VEDIIQRVLVSHGGNQTLMGKYLAIFSRALAYRLENQRNEIEKP